jgi:hypothetical protein
MTVNTKHMGGGDTPQLPGVVCVPSSALGRYREFDVCMSKLVVPLGTEVEWRIGLNIIGHINNTIRSMFKHNLHWVWIADDDSLFDPGILIRLLHHDVPVVAPFILRRSHPMIPTICKPYGDKYIRPGFDHYNGKSGLVDISGWCIGTAGMLIQRRVLEQIRDPWMENRKTTKSDFDLNFCRKLSEAGITLHIDLDTPMGHLTHVAVWPKRYGTDYVPTFRVPNPDDYYGHDEGIMTNVKGGK